MPGLAYAVSAASKKPDGTAEKKLTSAHPAKQRQRRKGRSRADVTAALVAARARNAGKVKSPIHSSTTFWAGRIKSDSATVRDENSAQSPPTSSLFKSSLGRNIGTTLQQSPPKTIGGKPVEGRATAKVVASVRQPLSSMLGSPSSLPPPSHSQRNEQLTTTKATTLLPSSDTSVTPSKTSGQTQSLLFNAFASRAAAAPVHASTPEYLVLPKIGKDPKRNGGSGATVVSGPPPQPSPSGIIPASLSVDSSQSGGVDPNTLFSVSRYIDSLTKVEHANKVKNTNYDSDSDIDIDSHSDDSQQPDDSKVDPAVAEGIGAFIDALQAMPPKTQEQSSNVTTPEGQKGLNHQSILSDERECSLNQGAPAKVGSAIKTVVMPNQAADDVSSSDSSDGDSVPKETKAGIGAYLDHLKMKNSARFDTNLKNPSRENSAMHISSSGDTADVGASKRQSVGKKNTEVDDSGKSTVSTDDKDEQAADLNTGIGLTNFPGQSALKSEGVLYVSTKKSPTTTEFFDGVTQAAAALSKSLENLRNRNSLIVSNPSIESTLEHSLSELDISTSKDEGWGVPQENSSVYLTQLNFIMKELVALYEGGRCPDKTELDDIRTTADQLGILPDAIQRLIKQVSEQVVREIIQADIKNADEDQEVEYDPVVGFVKQDFSLTEGIEDKNPWSTQAVIELTEEEKFKVEEVQNRNEAVQGEDNTELAENSADNERSADNETMEDTDGVKNEKRRYAETKQLTEDENSEEGKTAENPTEEVSYQAWYGVENFPDIVEESNSSHDDTNTETLPEEIISEKSAERAVQSPTAESVSRSMPGSIPGPKEEFTADERNVVEAPLQKPWWEDNEDVMGENASVASSHEASEVSGHEAPEIPAADSILMDCSGDEGNDDDSDASSYDNIFKVKNVAYEGNITMIPSTKGMLDKLEGLLIPKENQIQKMEQWQSPWNNKLRARTKNGCVLPLGGVAAAKAIERWCPRLPNEQRNKRLNIKRHWKQTYAERTKAHPGYFTVDICSLYNSSIVAGEGHSIDSEPWENREVKQFFLHEKSIGFSRNWCGDLDRKRGNDAYREPVCRPTSMEMPMDYVQDNTEWQEDWYLTWQSRKAMGAMITNSYSERSSKAGSSHHSGGSYSSCSSDDSSEFCESRTAAKGEGISADDESWEELAECGTIHNVKMKIGERVSRVHHNYTSSLRRSRWRKKYFPRGTFPY